MLADLVLLCCGGIIGLFLGDLIATQRLNHASKEAERESWNGWRRAEPGEWEPYVEVWIRLANRATTFSLREAERFRHSE